MKTTKWTEPELMVDDHHGVYMMQLWALTNKANNKTVWKQIEKTLDSESIESLLNGPDDENHFEACQDVENMTFKTETGQKFSIAYAEGGLWAIPFCFRGKKADDFFGC